MKAFLTEMGYAVVATSVSESQICALRDGLFLPEKAGQRCLLDDERVADVARQIRQELVKAGSLAERAVAIQAISFDKTPETNWKVAWHQDLMFPFAARPNAAGYEQHSVKQGVDYARPPLAILENLLAVRLHLDDCDETNGPLRVSPRTHRLGLIPSADVLNQCQAHGEVICSAKQGEALLMQVLTLHASSQASTPRHRRVLHLVFAQGDAAAENWYRTV